VDISYVWTREGWLYLAVVIDLFSRRVVGWAVGDRLHRDLALAALRKALVMRRPPKGFIHHSDRGSQGGFNRSSQHFEIGGVRWTSRSGVPADAPGRNYGHRDGRLLPIGKSAHCSGGM
jgi:transposase InsO family protein